MPEPIRDTARLAVVTILIGAAFGCDSRESKSAGSKAHGGEAQGSPWFENFTEASSLRFVHEVETSGQYLFSEAIGSGAAFLDFDNDGRLDVYLIHNVNPSAHATNRLFQQQADGRFQNVSTGSRVDVTGYGNGVAVGDVNNDGLPEILITEYDRIRLFLNLGNGKFADVTTSAGLTNDLWSVSASFFDYDRDGWLDLVVGNYLDFDPTQKCFDAKGQQDFCGPHGFHSTITRLYHNLGAGARVSPTGASTPGPSRPPPLSLSREGERALPRFEDATVRSGFSRAPGKAMQILCADFDGDFFPDVFITDDGLPNRLFMNQRDGTFKEEAVQRGVAYTGTGAALANMGIALGDVDGDGLFDLFVPHLTEENHTLWRQGPRGLFQDHTAQAGLLAMPWHGTGFAVVFADFDCDGGIDLAVANGLVRRAPSPRPSFPVGEREKTIGGVGSKVSAGIAPFWKPYAEPSQVFANDGSGHLREISSANDAFCGEAFVGRGLLCGDIDNDGGLDLLLTGVGGPARLYRNVASRRGHWLGVRAILPALGGRDAYDAEIVVEAGGRRWWRLVQPSYGYASSNDPRVHFGLGAVTKVDLIVVRWPDGSEERFPGGAVDRYLILRNGSGTLKR